MHGVCTVCVCVCMWACVGCCVVRRACYTLTGRDRWSEMHDGILWWAGRVWINIVDFNSTRCVCICVYVCVTIRPVCLCCVHWSFLLKPSWIFFLLKYSVLPSLYTPSSPYWLFSFIFYLLADALFRLNHSLVVFPTSSPPLSPSFSHLVWYLCHPLFLWDFLFVCIRGVSSLLNFGKVEWEGERWLIESLPCFLSPVYKMTEAENGGIIFSKWNVLTHTSTLAVWGDDDYSCHICKTISAISAKCTLTMYVLSSPW